MPKVGPPFVMRFAIGAKDPIFALKDARAVPDQTLCLPVSVPPHTRPMGIFGSFRAGRRNVLELILEIATRVPAGCLSGLDSRRP